MCRESILLLRPDHFGAVARVQMMTRLLSAYIKLANDGHDTRALQHYLGHKNIQHTVRYTDMAPDRFKDFWRG
jgi:integrase